MCTRTTPKGCIISSEFVRNHEFDHQKGLHTLCFQHVSRHSLPFPPTLSQSVIPTFLPTARVAICLTPSMPGKKVQSDRCVSMLKALADEHRWDIVRVLLNESLSVSQLGERLGISQPNVSKHLRILKQAGIIVTERAGKEVHGRITPAFRDELSRNKNRLDLGCCSFDFNSQKK